MQSILIINDFKLETMVGSIIIDCIVNYYPKCYKLGKFDQLLKRSYPIKIRTKSWAITTLENIATG